jgi:hypothetical protein
VENITKIFTSQDKQELRDAFKEIIIEQFKNDLEQLDIYLFNPDSIEAMIADVSEEIINEIKLEFKEKIRNELEKIMDINKILKGLKG